MWTVGFDLEEVDSGEVELELVEPAEAELGEAEKTEEVEPEEVDSGLTACLLCPGSGPAESMHPWE